MINKIGEQWPAEIKEYERIQKEFHFPETIYHIEENGSEPEKHISTSRFSKIKRGFEIHSTYLVIGERREKICVVRKPLSKVLHPFSEQDMQEFSKELPYQLN